MASADAGLDTSLNCTESDGMAFDDLIERAAQWSA